MKTRNLLTFGLAFLSATSAMAANRAPSYASQIVNTGVSLNQQISSSSLNSASSAANGQFKITKSGRYFLSTDIAAAPAASQIACIYIDASDVVLDLGGKTLTLSSTTYQVNSAAIEIAANKSDITIMNGTLNGKASTTSAYTRTGIKVNGGASNVLLDNVHVVNFAYDGIAFDATATAISDVIINNVRTYNIGAGLSLGATYASKSYARGLSLHGASATAINDVTIIDSEFNKTTTTGDVRTYGIFASYCNNLTLNNVKVSNTTGTIGAVRGILLANSTGVHADGVKVLRATSGSSGAPIVAGIDLATSSGCSFVNCSVNNGTSTHFTTTVYGFRLASTSNSNSFICCEARNNVGKGTSIGISLDAAHYNTIDKCAITGNGGTTQNVYGIRSGLHTNGGTTDYAATCSGTSIKNCKINNNVASSGNTYGISLSGDTGALIQECEIKSNISSGTCYGVALHHTSPRNVVEYNKIYSNKGTIGQYGFKDFADDSTTLLRGNVAFGHGATFAGGTSAITDSTSGMNYFLKFTEQSGQMNIQFLIKEGDIANMNAFEVGSPTWFNFSILHNSIAG
ncbi:right-handed parallel beta-helix repeat-containing protein [Candidatus Dependentiae bacterium]|nr:right-handed parallel beta-helix repeat-containing protein [Candidatus Dependentiae bacterium]